MKWMFWKKNSEKKMPPLQPIPTPMASRPYWGRAVDYVRKYGWLAWIYEVNEYGQWGQIGYEGSMMVHARLEYAERLKAMENVRPIYLALESDLDALLREFPGCDISVKQQLETLTRKDNDTGTPSEDG